MSEPVLAQVLNNPGKLCYGPTDLSTAFPHGGTAIGAVHKCAAIPVNTRKEIKDEAFGTEVHDVIWCGENWAFAAVLRQYDNAAMSLLFPNTAAGTTTQRTVVSSPGTVRPGTLLSTRAVMLLFSPLDPDRNPAVLFYKAIPLVDEASRMELALDKRMEVAALFMAIRDASARIVKVGLLKDLSL